jgi:ATP-binding cassette subfamily B protein
MRTVEAADKIIVLDEGRVVEEGGPKELLAREKGLFRNMGMLQSESNGWSV